MVYILQYIHTKCTVYTYILHMYITKLYKWMSVEGEYWKKAAQYGGTAAETFVLLGRRQQREQAVFQVGRFGL